MDEKAALLSTQGAHHPGSTTQYYAPPQYTEKPPITFSTQPLPTVQIVTAKKDYYNLSLLLIIIWALSCAPHLLCCSIPALFLARKGREYYAVGEDAAGDKKMRASLMCNLAAMVVGLVGWLFLVAAGVLGRVLPPIIEGAHKST